MKKIISSIFIILELFLLNSCTTTKKHFQPADVIDPLPRGKKSWTYEVDKSMKSLINPPEKISYFSKTLLNKAEKKFGKELLPGRILTWSTDLGVASGVLEMYIEKGAAKILKPRLIYLIRMQVSYYVSCPFAIDVNSWQYKDYKITPEEIQGLQCKKKLSKISSFSKRELTALRYSRALSKTPVSFDGKLLGDVRRLFSPEEIVAISTPMSSS
ncbi:hypothetical protein [Haliovirga abyssi]|uniref:Uncharacterized protein n=1 Tax=Haliovirga abyssi TaxID=2996794 RepID=A0AAU9DT82_9FUSO|nr:hypothetical protein [Haliovirga abyssi]BDU50334.1 hypothetical protein HLVA_09030 [Haliovirga abyssi]